MTQPPDALKIYHIAHVDKLNAIVQPGLLSDAEIRIAGNGMAAFSSFRRLSE
jgi:hypothetical protein